jgi:hypothetical protein
MVLMLNVTFDIITLLKTKTVSFEKKLNILHSLTTEEDIDYVFLLYDNCALINKTSIETENNCLRET